MHCRTAFFLALLTASSFASAETVYRCGSNYSEKPCAGGQPVDVGDARSSQQAHAAVQKTNVDARLADQLEKARLAQEARAPKAVIPPEHKPTPETKRVTLVKKGPKNTKGEEYVVVSEPRGESGSSSKRRRKTSD